MQKKTVGIIPARFGSSRFPGKPLVSIEGIPMVIRVYQQAKKVLALDEVIIATDHPEIFATAQHWKAEVVMTSDQHPSGTDRCLEVVQKLELKPSDIVVNIQGDEPFIAPEQIEQLAKICHDGAEIASLMKPLEDFASFNNPNVVKVVASLQNKALYFSRSPIPYFRGNSEKVPESCFHHVGLYAYSVKALQSIGNLQPSSLEKTEGLEQLRWLENGLDIHLGITYFDTQAVDSPEDLLKIQNRSTKD